MTNIKVKIIKLKKIKDVRYLINKILPYSAIKSNANPPAPYSVLNPETSSDSPSAKSKGARFTSARIETNHNPNTVKKGIDKIILLLVKWLKFETL